MSLDQLIYDATRGLADAPPRTRLITLTRGLYAVVDDADFERVGALRWHVCDPGGRSRTLYAAHREGKRGAYKLLHRFLLDAPSHSLADHRNGQGLDCRRCNLRHCSSSQNNANSAARRSGRPKGVRQLPSGNFHAYIAQNRSSISLGTFPTETAAALAYDTAAKQVFGEFARLNFPVIEGALDASRHDGQHHGEEAGACLSREWLRK